MKKQNLLLNLLMGMILSLSMISCDDNNDTNTDNTGIDENKTEVLTQTVDDVIIETYSTLADKAISLYEACTALNENLTQENINEACTAWAEARKYWELSEAFLYGAASDYNIDPHIDSWPLDKDQLDLALSNATLISNMKENGCNFDGFSTLGYGLLGFHAVEYMIFRDGDARDVNGGTDSDGDSYEALSEEELIYCQAIAEDLKNQCIRLEASWAGIENISEAKQQVLADTELEPSMNYGETMIEAGLTGNTLYKTQIAAYVQLLQGASDIADEVGNTKITDPVSSGDVLDVESWYSWNSIEDFANNIRSIQHIYLGEMSTDVNTLSISTYINSLDATLDNKIIEAIETAITEIEAMPAPFRNNLSSSETASAISACNKLMSLLEEAITLIQE